MIVLNGYMRACIEAIERLYVLHPGQLMVHPCNGIQMTHANASINTSARDSHFVTKDLIYAYLRRRQSTLLEQLDLQNSVQSGASDRINMNSYDAQVTAPHREAKMKYDFLLCSKLINSDNMQLSLRRLRCLESDSSERSHPL